jgi:cbb3-type cytochrome oxidase maturation protein
LSIVLLLIPLGIVLVAAAAVALIWAVDSGQYDGDLEEAGRVVLEPDEAPADPPHLGRVIRNNASGSIEK